MYALPEVADATAALWAGLRDALRRRGVAAPEALADPSAGCAWSAPGLAFGQTCGWPYATGLRGRVALVATPVHAAPGCEGPTYRSALLVRAADPARGLSDLRGRPVAINGADSWSGCHALRVAVAPMARDGRFFGAVTVSGAHRASAAMVRAGAADLCAVDCVTWALLGRHAAAETAGLRVLGWTDPAPALPYIAAGDPGPARAALAETLADPALADARDALLLAGAETLDPAAYDAMTAAAARADAQGYPALA